MRITKDLKDEVKRENTVDHCGNFPQPIDDIAQCSSK